MSSPHKLKDQTECSRLTSDSLADLAVPQVDSPYPPTPHPRAGSPDCVPKFPSIPTKYFIVTTSPPPAETVLVAALGTVIVKTFALVTVI